MNILKKLSPEQISSLTPEQVNALLNIKKDKTHKLKSLVMELNYSEQYHNDYNAKKVTTKILEILLDNPDTTYYLIGKQQGNYRLFTYPDLQMYVNSSNDLAKMEGQCIIDNATKNKYISIILQAENVVVVNPILLKAYAIFKGNIDEVNEFLMQ